VTAGRDAGGAEIGLALAVAGLTALRIGEEFEPVALVGFAVQRAGYGSSSVTVDCRRNDGRVLKIVLAGIDIIQVVWWFAQARQRDTLAKVVVNTVAADRVVESVVAIDFYAIVNI
jgi:hypothetical protein